MNKRIFTAILVMFVLVSYPVFSQQARFNEKNWNENVKDQQQIDLAIDKGYKVSGEQFTLASEAKKEKYVLEKNYDNSDEYQKQVLRQAVLQQPALLPQARKNLVTYLQTEDFKTDEGRYFFIGLSSAHIEVINDNLGFFEKYAENVENIKFQKFQGKLRYDDESFMFVLRDSGNEIFFLFLQQKLDEGYLIEVDRDGNIHYKKGTYEIVLNNAKFAREPATNEFETEQIKHEFKTGQIRYSNQKPPIVIPDNCQDCSVQILDNGQLLVKGSSFPIPNVGVLQGYSVKEDATPDFIKRLKTSEQQLKAESVNTRKEGDKIILEREFGEATLTGEKILIKPLSSIVTQDGTFSMSPIKKTTFGSTIIDFKQVAFFNDNLDRSNEVSSYIQSSPESGVARLVPRYNQQIIADLKVDGDGNPAHRYKIIDIDSLGGKAEVNEGKTVVVSENGELKSKHLPKTYVITSTGYYASEGSIGKCTTTCFEVIKTLGIDREPALVLSIQKLNEWYKTSKDTSRKIDNSNLDFTTASSYLISLYSRDASEKVLNAIISYGDKSLPILDRLIQDRSVDIVPLIEKIYKLGTPESTTRIGAYLSEDSNLKLPTAIAIGKSKDPRAILIYGWVINGNEHTGEYLQASEGELQSIVSNLLKYETDEAKELIDMALESGNKQIKYGTAIALAENKDEGKDGGTLKALYARIIDNEERDEDRLTAIRLLTNFELRTTRELIQDIMTKGDDKTKQIVAIGLLPRYPEGIGFELSPEASKEKAKEELGKLFYSKLNERARLRVIDTLESLLAEKDPTKFPDERAQDIVLFLASLDDEKTKPQIKSALEKGLKSENKQASFATALGIAKLGKMEEFSDTLNVLKEITLDEDTGKAEKIDALALIRFHSDKDTARDTLKDIYLKAKVDSIKDEALIRLARVGDFSIMEDLLKSIKNPEEKGFTKAELTATVVEERHPRDKFLDALNILFKTDPSLARETLEKVSYTDEFVTTLKTLTKDHSYSFDRRDYWTIVELSKRPDYTSRINSRMSYLEGESFNLKDAVIVLNAPDELLSKPKAELEKELDIAFKGKKIEKRTDENGQWYTEDWQNARGKLTKPEVVKVAVMEKHWREGNYKIVYDESNRDYPQLQGRELTMQDLIDLDIKEDNTELGGMVQYVDGQVIFRIFDAHDKKTNGAYYMKESTINENKLSSLGDFHLHAVKKINPSTAGPSGGGGGGGDLGETSSIKIDGYILTPVKDGINLDYTNTRLTVVDLGIRGLQ
ncbi:MAG: hypothetical protein Q8R04_05365 [Nanoarchaeota archaeon]|nr:hypothetical protein [Nanoarchaeota archaeon]